MARFLAFAALLVCWPADASFLQYAVGDRVECDPAQIGQFKQGTVVPYPKNDVDTSGRYFYVRLDGSHIPEGYLCMATHMRPVAAEPHSPGALAGGDGPITDRRVPRADRPARDRRARNRSTEDRDRPARTRAPQVNAAPPPAAQNPPEAAPRTAGTLPPLPGTAWKMDFGIRTANVQRFLFCRSGRWEVVSSQLLTGGALSMMGTYTVQGDTLVTRDANGGAVTTYKMAADGNGLQLDSGKSKMRLYEPVPTECK